MTIQEQVKNCPFCGKYPNIHKFNNTWFISCDFNKANHNVMIASKYQARAIKAWNTRSPEPKQFSGYSTETPKGDV